MKINVAKGVGKEQRNCINVDWKELHFKLMGNICVSARLAQLGENWGVSSKAPIKKLCNSQDIYFPDFIIVLQFLWTEVVLTISEIDLAYFTD